MQKNIDKPVIVQSDRSILLETDGPEFENARDCLATFAEVAIHGADDRGNMVAVFETATGEAMERLIKTLSNSPLILHVGITYLNMEDLLPDPAENG